MPLPPQVRIICQQIHKVHIADGFADDCEELIHRWLKSDLFTYETFCEIWKDMQFDSLFHGRPTGAELAELSEEVINIAKYYMITNPDNFEESVAGLFLVYALLNLQPYPGFAALRIVPEDVPAITNIEMTARRTRRYDVLYILGSVLTAGPVQFHAVAREHGMESSIRKYLDGTTGIDRLGVRPKGVFYRQNEELDLLRELNNITRRYAEAKRNIPGSNISLNYTNEKFAIELDNSLKEIINGIVEEGDEANKKITDHYSTVQAIKAKAMKQSVDSVKFLSTSAARIEKKAMETKKLKKPDGPENEQGKKHVSPKELTKKRRCSIRANTYKYGSRKRRRRTKFSSSSSSESIDLSLEDITQDEDSQDSQGSNENIEVVTDLNLDDLKAKYNNLHPIDDTDMKKSLNAIEFDKDPEKHEKLDSINDKDARKHVPKIVNPLNDEIGGTLNPIDKEIDIQALPVFIRSEQDGSLFEIEIVDKMPGGATPLGQLEVFVTDKPNPKQGTSKSDGSNDKAEIFKVIGEGEDVEVKKVPKKRVKPKTKSRSRK